MARSTNDARDAAKKMGRSVKLRTINMKSDKINIEVCKLLKWTPKNKECSEWDQGFGVIVKTPDFCESLNAINTAEIQMMGERGDIDDYWIYEQRLRDMAQRRASHDCINHLPARDRAEALLRFFAQWEEA